MSMMGANFSDLFFITMDAPEGTNVISVDEAFRILLLAWKSVAHGHATKQNLLEDAH